MDTNGARAITFAHVKGGVGKTSLAINMAVAAHKLSGYRTVVVDLDGAAPLSSMMFGGFSEQNITRALRRLQDGETIEDLVAYAPDFGVWVLRGDVRSTMSETAIGYIPALINEIKQIFVYDEDGFPGPVDFVVVDTPGQTREVIMAVLLAVEYAAIPFKFSDIDQAPFAIVNNMLNVARSRHDQADGVQQPLLLGLIPNEVKRNDTVGRFILGELAERGLLLPFIPYSNYFRTNSTRENAESEKAAINITPESSRLYAQLTKLWRAIDDPNSMDREANLEELNEYIGI